MNVNEHKSSTSTQASTPSVSPNTSAHSKGSENMWRPENVHSSGQVPKKAWNLIKQQNELRTWAYHIIYNHMA